MAPRTRSITSSPVKKVHTVSSTTPEASHSPVKILIAPGNLSPETRILSLKHPVNAVAKQFIFCPQNGVFEIKKTILPTTDPRSVVFSPNTYPDASQLNVIDLESCPFAAGYINKDAEILTATPYDFAFILLSVIAPRAIPTKKALFQPLDDLLDSPESNDRSLKYILSQGIELVKAAMLRICDSVKAGDEEMYRYNEEKVFKLVLEKARRISRSGLPASLEEQFVTRVLEAPMMSIKREETSVSILTSSRTTASTEDQSQDTNIESQSSTASTTPSVVFSEVSNTSTIVTIPEDSVPADIEQLQRIKTAYNFIAATCLPPFLTARLSPKLSEDKSIIDFSSLEEYLKKLATLRAEAAASRSMTDFSRKRGLEDEEIAEERAEKKRKQEEEEKKRKANESRGVKELKKVNVSGMKKMSDFFAKKTTTVTIKTKT